MRLEEQVCGLELAKKLKELGVKQESIFYWRDLQNVGWRVTPHDQTEHRAYDSVSAFTVAELGEMLRIDNSMLAHPTSIGCYWGKKWCFYEWGKLLAKADTEADARAKMLIYLLENKIIAHTDIKGE